MAPIGLGPFSNVISLSHFRMLTVGRMSEAHVAHICELATSCSSRAGTYQRHGYSAFSSKSEMGSLCNPHRLAQGLI